jgi:hypothetical protein
MQSRNIYHPLMLLSYKLLPTKVVQSCCIGQKGVGAMLLPKASTFNVTLSMDTHTRLPGTISTTVLAIRVSIPCS